jgi:hypothetical protein
MRQRRALLERYALNRNERADVHGAYARMNSRMGSEIDSLSGNAGQAHCRVHHKLGASGEGEDGAMVILVAGLIEQRRSHGVGQRGDYHGVAPFGEIRYALD